MLAAVGSGGVKAFELCIHVPVTGCILALARLLLFGDTQDFFGMFFPRQELLRPGFARVGVHFTMSDSELELLEQAVLWVADTAWRLLAAYTFEVTTGEWRHRLEAEDKQRRWLSSVLPPSVNTSVDGAKRDAAIATLTSADELKRAADRMVSSVHSTQCLPLASVRIPKLDSAWADLVSGTLAAAHIQRLLKRKPTDCSRALNQRNTAIRLRVVRLSQAGPEAFTPAPPCCSTQRASSALALALVLQTS